MRIKTFSLLTLLLATVALGLPALAQQNPEDWSGELVWPREYSNEAGAKLVMYQPQVTKWKGAKHLEARLAIAFSAPGAETPSLGFTRSTNNAGGLEAGMTNSQPLIIRAAKKPISTLAKPLGSINMQTKQGEEASYERSDI